MFLEPEMMRHIMTANTPEQNMITENMIHFYGIIACVSELMRTNSRFSVIPMFVLLINKLYGRTRTVCITYMFICQSKRSLPALNMMNMIEAFQRSRLVRICRCILGESNFQVNEGDFGALIVGILIFTTLAICVIVMSND